VRGVPGNRHSYREQNNPRFYPFDLSFQHFVLINSFGNRKLKKPYEHCADGDFEKAF
jgi:hypothetical protein